MPRAKSWMGPFTYRTDHRCVKCEKNTEYFVGIAGMTLGVCREHAIEAAASKEGGRTMKQATDELNDIDAGRRRSANARTEYWRRVDDELPKPGIDVLVVLSTAPDRVEAMTLCRDKKRWMWGGDAHRWPVSHWMPMPRVPTA